MLKTPELAMLRTNKVTTVCNGKREVWTDYEQAKAYFLEMMMTAEGEEHDRAEVYISSLCTGWMNAVMRTNKLRGRVAFEPSFIFSNLSKNTFSFSITASF